MALHSSLIIMDTTCCDHSSSVMVQFSLSLAILKRFVLYCTALHFNMCLKSEYRRINPDIG